MEARESKRELIAAAARELFAKYGYKLVSMDTIALKSGVAKGTLYLYFKDKEELFYYLLDEFLEDMRRMVEKIKSRSLPLHEEVSEVIYRLLMYRKSQKFLFRIFSEARELKTQMAQNGVKKIDQLVECYLNDRLSPIAGIEQIKVNVEVLTFVIMKTYSALAFEWEETHDPLNERQIAQIIGYLLRNLTAKPQSAER